MKRLLTLASVSVALLAGYAEIAGASIPLAPRALEQAVPRYELEVGPGADSLLNISSADSSRAVAEGESTGDSLRPSVLWTRDELQTLAARVRDRLLARGAISSVVRLTLAPGAADGRGVARIAIERRPAPSRVIAVVRGAEEVVPDAAGTFRRASGGGGEPGAILAGLEAIRDEAQAKGRFGAEATLDSIVLADSATARIHVSLRCGPPVTLDSLDLGGSAMRPSVVASISGLRKGSVLTPTLLDDARARLQASELFSSVGLIEVEAGAEPGRARVVAPVVENRLSRFEGAVGVQNGGGITGLFDLALGNIGGSGRSAGAKWAGFGAGRSDYAARYREPSLFRSGLDAQVALEAQVADSLYTQTRWSLELSGRPAANARAAAALRRSGSAYTGAGRGTSATWSVEGRVTWRKLLPLENPTRGFGATLAGEVGRRVESYPGYARTSRGVLKGTLTWEAVQPTGTGGALYAAMRAERVDFGGGALPAEELRFLGGSEGLRGHRDRAFGGDRVLGMTLEHRWITGPRGGRVFLFVDGARHDLGVPVEAGSARGNVDLGASLARTELSPGWEFGYGAGLRSPTRAGTIGIELGLKPGAPLREGKLHLHYATDW
ncbi:MAG TPA: hypothetical protein VGK76_09350 [Candidatus Eisenbacteria bacterium]